MANSLWMAKKSHLEAKFYGTDNGKMDIHNKAELDEILKELENEEFEISEVKKARESRMLPLPFTNQYLAAGGIQNTEFFNPEDYASGTAACMRVLISRATVL